MTLIDVDREPAVFERIMSRVHDTIKKDICPEDMEEFERQWNQFKEAFKLWIDLYDTLADMNANSEEKGAICG